MTAHRRDDPLGDAIRAILSPKPPEPTATPRVALLNPGDGTLKRVLEGSGLEVVHEHTPKERNDKLDFGRIPVFDLIAAYINEDPGEVNKTLELVARFLHIRRPKSFVLVGEAIDQALMSAVHVKTWRMGYGLVKGDALIALGEDSGRGQCSVLVGTLDGVLPDWQPRFIPGPEARIKESDEGQDEPLDKYSDMQMLGGVIGAVIQYIREDETYFDDDLAEG